MLGILKKINVENFKKSLMEIYSCFPLSALISLLAFILIVTILRFSDVLNQDFENILLKLFISLAIGFFFSLSLYSYAESREFKKSKKNFYQIFTFIFILLFYYFFDEGLFSGDQAETAVYIILTIIGVVAFLFIARYMEKFSVKTSTQEGFYVSSYLLVVKFIMSAIVGLASMLLGFLALTAVFTLFEVEFLKQGNWFGYWAGFSWVLFAPYFFLANLAVNEKDSSPEMDQFISNKFYSFLINFVALPAIYIYFVILYAYTIKVLLNFSDWPRGEVSWMVILFSFFGHLVYFASFAFVSRFKHAGLFRKILPTAVLLQTPMLFYSIGLRINQYDLTINRYLVVVFGLWLVFLSLYFIISKKKDLSMPFYSLLVTVIIMSIGPWSVYLVPEWRQFTRLENNLHAANILKDGRLVPLESYRDIDAELSGNIYGGIEYLCNFHGCDTLDSIFKEKIEEIKKNDEEEFYKNKQEQIERMKNDNADAEDIKRVEENEFTGTRNWTIINSLSEYLKVERYNQYAQPKENPRFLRFESTSLNMFGQDIKVQGYDYYVPLSMDGDKYEDEIMRQKLEGYEKTETYRAFLDTNEYSLVLSFEEEVLEKIDIKEEVIDTILDNQDKYIEPKHSDPGLRAMLKEEDMSFALEGEKFDVLLVLRSISIPNPDWVDDDKGVQADDKIMPRMTTISPFNDGYVLIKQK
jgi:hypothetical protein